MKTQFYTKNFFFFLSQLFQVDMEKNSTKLNVSCTKLLWWKLIFELEGGINFSEEEGLRAHMRFSLATTSVGEGKKSDQHSKNRDPLKEN